VNEGGVEVGGRAASGVHCPKLVTGVKSQMGQCHVVLTWMKNKIKKYQVQRNHNMMAAYCCIVPTFSYNNDGI
jgi:hypothetical protein